MNKENWSRISEKPENGVLEIRTFGCDCCSSYKYSKKPDWQDEEFYHPITQDDCDTLILNLENQLKKARKLKHDLFG